MNKIIVGYDDNLGIPDDFSTIINAEVMPYHDLAKMITDFDDEKLHAIFVPVGTLPYITNYEVIAEAQLRTQTPLKMRSNFVSTKNIYISEVPNLIIGRVNQYCTTSFWSPLIYLMKYLAENTVLTFQNTDSFPDMLHKTADNEIDCCMIWDVIMQQNPNDANKVHELFSKQDLPTPVIISRPGFDSNIQEKIDKFITQDKKSFFNGFQTPDKVSIDKFLFDIEAVKKHFQIKISNEN